MSSIKRLPIISAVVLVAAGVGSALALPHFAAKNQLATITDEREKHFRNVTQLTFGGENAEAYFSSDGKQLIFQSQRDGYPCDQQFVMNTDGTNLHRVSTGTGRTTCGWFFDHDRRVLFSSTHGFDPVPPIKPDYSHGYVWPVYNTYSIYTANADGTNLKPLFPKEVKLGQPSGYNAESVVSPDGKKVVFTSDTGGDLDIWVMNIDGSRAKQLTHTLGYDGGPWWSPDGKKICYRAYHPETPEEIADYKGLLAQHLIRPTTLDLYVMNADGSDQHAVTHEKSQNIASFAPSWTRDGKSLVFSSNRADDKRRAFEVYKINLDGTGLERLTYGGQFDGFPNFSPDGKKIIWASNRHGKVPHETNLYIADWVP